ncbi:hypothetical protein ETSB_0063 [cyanobacterium endosymbiont of Epithemia turgida isolate EtSB Lake Yunoko]|nr:hypothetical protein ETSB_0063 [cyanobacterium endosymbiont of Epithemia turgida isolate EtSB Lake Yunoko]
MGQETIIVVGEMRQLATLEADNDNLFKFVILLALNQSDSFSITCSITYESILLLVNAIRAVIIPVMLYPYRR